MTEEECKIAVASMNIYRSPSVSGFNKVFIYFLVLLASSLLNICKVPINFDF